MYLPSVLNESKITFEAAQFFVVNFNFYVKRTKKKNNNNNEKKKYIKSKKKINYTEKGVMPPRVARETRKREFQE